MGYGDEIMGSGMARGARARGKRIAFGDGSKIRWSEWAPIIYRNNPNVAPPGSEGASDLEWVAHYKGARKYNRQVDGKWEWNYKFRATPGEFFFSESEKLLGGKFGSGFVIIEPNVPWQKTVAPNKDWGQGKYEQVALCLVEAGYRVVQFKHKNSRRVISCAEVIEVGDLRQAASVLSNASLYVGPEGGMHHSAAAVGVNGVVLFGGFIPPLVTGYSSHINLTGGDIFCGKYTPCNHCREAMERITVEHVLEASLMQLESNREVRNSRSAE